MGKKSYLRLLWLFLLVLFLLPLANVRAQEKKSLVGQETSYFSLPSTQDRLIQYLEEYYGKYHLIITFFPAAFTPI